MCLRPARGAHRPADEPRLHPPRRPGAGPARGRGRARSASSSRSCRSGCPTTTSCSPASRSGSSRLKDVGYLAVDGCLALGVTGPILRSAGLPWDLRKVEPYLRLRDLRLRGADRRPTADCWGRYLVRVAEMRRVAQDHRAGAGPAASPAR